MDVISFRNKDETVQMRLRIPADVHKSVTEVEQEARELGGEFRINEIVTEALRSAVKEAKKALAKRRAEISSSEAK